MRKISEQFEVAIGRDERDEAAKRFNIDITEATVSEFHSGEVTFKGQALDPKSENFGHLFHCTTVSDLFRYEHQDEDEEEVSTKEIERREAFYNQLGSHKISGLHCPDCGSQAFTTDHKNIAVCGDYPGWYFFYRKLDQEKTGEKRMKLIIRNGKYELVEDDSEDIKKDHV